MHFNTFFFAKQLECPIFAPDNKTQQVMNDSLIKVNAENENRALNRCQQILQDRREALASKAKKNNL